ncbi:unnamed protein product [Rotaria magnacalcarata]|uniref:ADP ribosyltransferase domain-containing protein n=3 Tax=Rotaria magnacalcarata TaxID=392030 RepID=A0A820DXJ4_9BILA|nr:unnamed protein product [Rotaria magnacalcarata]CAF4237917.1 unnamed protein product [Rotaria magnacalcarata]
MAFDGNETRQLNHEQYLENDENENAFCGNKETITLIWFDQNIQLNMKDIQLTKNMLREINDYVLFFAQLGDCIHYIKSVKSETIFLIVSGSDADVLLSEIHDLRQVDSIFIFCMDKLKYEKALIEKANYYKIIDIFIQQNSLIKSIQRNIQLAEKQINTFNLYNQNQKSSRNITNESGSFIWHQLLKDVLQKMPSGDKNAKEEMLNKCRLYYRGNQKELRNIEQFNNAYSIANALEWYTKDSFIYKLINKALRTEDVEALYTFRFYLIDLCSQLVDNHEWVLKCYKLLKLYRGTKQTQDEIQRLKNSIGHLILTNGFLSTSKSREVAEIYAGIAVVNTNASSKNLESIIFEIDYNTSIHRSSIVADVTCYSRFRDEQEFLFDLGTVFEIQDVAYDEEKKYWICKMTPSDKGLEIAKEYVNFQRNEMHDTKLDIFVLFGNLLYDMGEYIKCRHYFEDLLHVQRNQDSSTTIDIYRGLGRVFLGIKEIELSRKYLQHAYDLCIKSESTSSNKLGIILSYIGYTYDYQGKFNTALEYYFKGLQILERDLSNKRSIAYTLTRIGTTYYDKGQDDLALEYLKKSYKYLESSVPEDHPDMTEYYNNMCMVQYHKGCYDQALYYQIKSYEGDKRILPVDNHMHLSADTNNIGKCYYKKCQYTQAMEYFEQSLDIARRVLKGDDNYRDMGMRINNIGKCFYREKNYSEALKHYEIVLKLIQKANLNDHVDKAYTLKNMGEVYLDLFNFDFALNYFTEALDMYKKTFNDLEHRDVAKCLHLIGQVYYCKNNDDDNAMCQDCYDKALNIWKNVLPGDHPDLALCYKSMALFYLHRKLDYIEAEKYFSISYHMCKQALTEDHPHLIEIHNIRQMISKSRRQATLFMTIDTVQIILFLFLFSIVLWF